MVKMNRDEENKLGKKVKGIKCPKIDFTDFGSRLLRNRTILGPPGAPIREYFDVHGRHYYVYNNGKKVKASDQYYIF